VQRARQELDVAATLASWPDRVRAANRSQAELAKDAGLVDAVITQSAWNAKLKARLGDGDKPDRPGDYRRIDFRDYWAARRSVAERGPAVAVVHVAGSIVDGEAPAGTAGGSSIRRLIEDAVANDDVKAIVVRVDSGGGSALASDEIRQAMLEARARKLPVVASFGPVAASGGYWVGTGADTIFASPATVTGSIGVFGVIPTFETTLKQLGVSTDGVTTTPFSGQPDLAGGLNDATRALIQGGVQDIYQQFLTIVAGARKMPVAEVAPIAEGRVWSGSRAKALKLIDQYGDLQAAIREAGRLAGLKGEPRILIMRQPQPFLLQMISRLSGGSSAPAQDAMARAVAISRMRAAAQVEAAIAVANGPTVQAHCLTCTGYSVPARAAACADIPALVKSLLAD
jgi:protease-4